MSSGIQRIVDALIEADETAYYARWGYDGMGTPGPIEAYRKPQPHIRTNFAVRPFEKARDHKKGHGWKENHKS